jgi:NAD(P)-dependent dehydrogenase (short-subunit alcohol dehydrogenase family)
MGNELLERLFSLKGKTAVITGGYKGIGLKIAETYAEVGADVVIVARNLAGCEAAAADIALKYGVTAMGASMDVNDSARVNAVIAEIAEKFGKIDILVNSAGVPGSEKPILKMTDNDMNDVMNVDFRGIFYVCRAVASLMAKNQSGHIINIASLAGKIASPRMSGYCASKAAVIHMTRVMALEWIKNNIQVNVLCPGYFLTEFNKDFFASEMGQALVKKSIPMNRLGQLDELQSLSLFLATCPSFMTGTEIYIDGGHGIV